MAFPFFPSEHLVFETTLTPEEIVERLRALVAPFTFKTYWTLSYIGEVGASGFCCEKYIPSGNQEVRVRISGHFQPHAHGTRVLVKLDSGPVVPWLLMSVMLVSLGAGVQYVVMQAAQLGPWCYAGIILLLVLEYSFWWGIQSRIVELIPRAHRFLESIFGPSQPTNAQGQS
jgi:hypothetical protein